jgi:hypothetical protein
MLNRPAAHEIPDSAAAHVGEPRPVRFDPRLADDARSLRGDFVIAPIPFTNPTSESGLGVAALGSISRTRSAVVRPSAREEARVRSRSGKIEGRGRVRSLPRR